MFSLGQCLIIQRAAFKRWLLKYDFDLFHENGCILLSNSPIFNPYKVLETSGLSAFKNKCKNAIYFFPLALKSVHQSIRHAKDQQSVALSCLFIPCVHGSYPVTKGKL